MQYYSSHLLVLEYSCGHWQGFNVQHKSEHRMITQQADCLCAECNNTLLPGGAIENAIKSGAITVDEMVKSFRDQIEANLKGV